MRISAPLKENLKVKKKMDLEDIYILLFSRDIVPGAQKLPVAGPQRTLQININNVKQGPYEMHCVQRRPVMINHMRS